MMTRRGEQIIWGVVTAAVAGVLAVLVATWSAGCGAPFLRCKELEIGRGADAGGDAGGDAR